MKIPLPRLLLLARTKRRYARSVLPPIAQPLEPRLLLTTLATFELGASDAIQLADLDGHDGQEIIATLSNTNVAVHNNRLGTVTNFTSSGWDSIHVANLFDNTTISQQIYTITGSVVTVMNPSNGSANSYDMGTFTTLQLADLDGQPGLEFVAFNGNVATVLKPSNGSISTYTSALGAFLGVADLTNDPGSELYTATGTTFGTLNVNSSNSTSTQIGAWDSFRTSNIDGISGDELIQIRASLVTIRSLRGPGTTNTYNVGVTSSLTFADLDGQAGNEIYLTRPGQILVVNNRTHTIKIYNTGAYATAQNDNLNGTAGDEIYLTRSGAVVIVNPRNQSLTTISTGLYDSIQTGDVDGFNGDELLLAHGPKVTVINRRLGTVKAITLGAYTQLMLAQLGTLPGLQLVAGRSNSVTTANMLTGAIKTINIPAWITMQFGEVNNGLAGQEMITASTNHLTIQNLKSTVVPTTMFIGSWSLMGVTDLDGVSGDEVFFTNGTTLTVLTFIAVA